MNNDADDLPGYLLPWVGVIPMHELQAGAQAAREHQTAQEARTVEHGQGHQHQGDGQHPPGPPATREDGTTWD